MRRSPAQRKRQKMGARPRKMSNAAAASSTAVDILRRTRGLARAAAASTLAERLFRILIGFRRNVRLDSPFDPHPTEEDVMRKLGFVIAALGAIAVVVPSIASAETVVIKRGGYHHGYGARAMMHHDNGWHRGWRHHHRDRVVVIKKSYHRY